MKVDMTAGTERTLMGSKINITGLKPVVGFVSGLAATDPPLPSRPFAFFGQFLSPRVFLTQVSGRCRVGEGKEKLHRYPADSETPWK